MTITPEKMPKTPTGHRGVYNSILDAMGNTPMVRLHRVTGGAQPDILAKVEFFNPGGSVKDRIGLSIIEEAERSGRLKPGGTVVESTSGNTGVGLAIVAALKGYKSVFVMPDKMSDEKIRLLRAFGARVIITPTAVTPEDPRSYYSVARSIAENTPNAILANQYHNPVNPQVHFETTGPEIWEQTGGKIDVFVACMGTGGTISGIGRYLKSQNPDIQIVGVDPIGSLLHHYFYTGEMSQAHSYLVEGFGEDFLPSTLDFSTIDDVVQVTDRESFDFTRRLVREEGIFAGGSAGSAIAGALRYIKMKNIGADKTIVVLLPDSGSRYLSKVFNDDWMRENSLFSEGCADATVQNILDTKSYDNLISVNETDLLTDVITLLKDNGISQAPVLGNGKLIGIVRELDLLQHMLKIGRRSTPDETIADVVQRRMVTIGVNAPLQSLLSMLVSGNDHVLVVKNAESTEPEALGILTKIDVLDYVATYCM